MSDNATLEDEFAKLEAIVSMLESGELDIEKGVGKFEEGMKLAAKLKTRLEAIENKVEKIKLNYEDKPSDK